MSQFNFIHRDGRGGAGLGPEAMAPSVTVCPDSRDRRLPGLQPGQSGAHWACPLVPAIS